MEIVLWSQEWWVLGLMSLTVLFMLLFGLFIASYKVLKRSLGWGSPGLGPSYVETSLAAGSSLGAGLPSDYPTVGELIDGDRGKALNKWVNRIFIAIVLQCTALYLMSQYPGMESPFWLGIVLQGFTYGSAALFYASGQKEIE
jgi:hypothetical protein